MVKAKKFVLIKHFDGYPKESDFVLENEELPDLKDGEFLTEAVYLSVDPFMRSWAPKFHLGMTMVCRQIAKIIESKNENFPIGKFVAGSYGWRTHTISTNETDNMLQMSPMLVQEICGLPLSLALGVLGLPGYTAYFGFLEICKPKKDETVVVSGAAGAVGSHVGQIAKIIGCYVIGIAGSEEKVFWCKSLGFDHVINYKTENIEDALLKAAPNGIDCYFDNVGGEISSTVIRQMNQYGRISVCGSISGYNTEKRSVPRVSTCQEAISSKELKMEGFFVYRWKDRWSEAFEQNLKWIKEGKLKYKEHTIQGFENMPKALIGVLKGENIGKAIVKV